MAPELVACPVPGVELGQSPCSCRLVLGKAGSGAEPGRGWGSPGRPTSACLGRREHPVPALEKWD